MENIGEQNAPTFDSSREYRNRQLTGKIYNKCRSLPEDEIRDWLVLNAYKLADTYNISQPYHNRAHMQAVAHTANIILTNTLSESPARDKMEVLLFVAASLHDLNHSAGKDEDAENIRNAVALIENEVDKNIKSIARDFLNSVINTIRVTEFPFIKEPETLVQMCLRDADLLMVLESDFEAFQAGLSVETNKHISYKDTIEFLSNQTFFTKYGKKLFSDYLNSKLHKARLKAYEEQLDIERILNKVERNTEYLLKYEIKDTGSATTTSGSVKCKYISYHTVSKELNFIANNDVKFSFDARDITSITKIEETEIYKKYC